MPGRVLTVASGKGGVGKTTTAVNLAVALWTEGQSVAVVDADLGMANLGALLGLEPETTLHHVLAGRASVDEALVEAKDGDLLVLPGARSLIGFADADPNRLEAVIEELAERCDVVIVDTGAGLSYEDVLPLGLADGVILVSTPDPAAIGDTRKTLQLSGLLAGDVLGVVVNRAQERTDAEAIAEEIGADLLGVIPDDSAVLGSTHEAQPLASHAPDAPATEAYAELASVILGRADPAAEDLDDPDGVAEPADDGPAGDYSVDEPTADGETDADDAEDADDTAATEDPDHPNDDDDAAKERRGGVTGWLGRLFS